VNFRYEISHCKLTNSAFPVENVSVMVFVDWGTLKMRDWKVRDYAQWKREVKIARTF